MSWIDWTVFIITLLVIILYGIWKSRGTKTLESYFLADRKLPWYHVALSVMATQASAITYLSAPGQAYSDGMRFVQFYFGLPLAMIFISIFILPVYKKWNVFTAYEYLEDRFNNKTRSLTAALFLIQRGISTGITIYAPAIILATLLSINIYVVIIITGVLVMAYTMLGGTKAVSYTEKLQMGVIFTSLFLVFFLLLWMLPQGVSFSDSLHLAGKMGKLNAIDFHFDLNNRYNVWSGIIGGFFLQLSYFGTDQSQVGRYLTGASVDESRRGLLMNGLIKIPMQFFILLLGAMVFSFYQLNPQPIYFNTNEVQKIAHSNYKPQYDALVVEYNKVHDAKQVSIQELMTGLEAKDESKISASRNDLVKLETRAKEIKSEAVGLMKQNDPTAETDDTNYIFLYFITHNLPLGVIGLLMAVILLAAMGATASGISSLTSTTVIDFVNRFSKKKHEGLGVSRLVTVAWSIFCILIALFAGKMGNLLEAVNILGSLFYGVILGIFITAIFLKKVGGNAVFLAALVAEVFVFSAWMIELTAFLWLNLIGCALVMIFALVFENVLPRKKTDQSRI